MNTRQGKPSAVDTQFDEWAKAVAQGLTRRKTLQLLGGTFTGAFLALSGSKARAATTAPTTGGGNGCGQICAPLFNPRNQTQFNACTQACEDCKTCHGNPGLSSTAPQVLTCTGATPCRSGGGVICCTGGQNCCNHTCVTGTCCGTAYCPPGKVCCLGNPPMVCYAPCPTGQSLNPSTCACVCNSGTLCNGNCVSCSGGQILNTSTCQCVCPSVTCEPNQHQDPTTCACVCNSGTTACGSTCCSSTQTCCGGAACHDPCPTGQTLNPNSCQCSPPIQPFCVCNNAPNVPVALGPCRPASELGCTSGILQSPCSFACRNAGGVLSVTCTPCSLT